jgi:uncharacterized protein YbjT (DUF2867 family)
MKIFVAGATGALGRALVPRLVARDRIHAVIFAYQTGLAQPGAQPAR